MPSDSREGSRDRELTLKHMPSFSESSRASVPMWDSSDPDRAPPPLPMNPSPHVATTRPNTSAAIAARAQALEDKARESAPASSYTTNAMPSPSKSPERSLIKGAHHKRLQSLQTSSGRDLRSYLDTNKSPERSPERPSQSRSDSPISPMKEEQSGSGSEARLRTPTRNSRDSLKETPNLRPSSRSGPRSILGESTTPPSATMLALQKMSARDYTPFSDTNTGSPPSPTKTPRLSEGFSSSMISLTNMMSNLQREMQQLSRRSKDNATDLISLKEATNTRDEDIRKSLRELANNVTSGFKSTNAANTRISSSLNLPFLDNAGPPSKPGTPSKRPISLPRIPSPSNFVLDDRCGSPRAFAADGTASVAMLEKIIREMSTKEGQDRLLEDLNHLFEKANEENAKKISELTEFIRDNRNNQALVSRSAVESARGIGGPDGPPRLDLHFDGSPTGPASRAQRGFRATDSDLSQSAKPYASPKAADFVGDQMLSLLRKIKDSVSDSGCMVGETKANVRDLRAQVLIMGRDLGEKVDELERTAAQANSTGGRKSGVPADGQIRQDVERIVRDGLEDLKAYMDRQSREKRRVSGSSMMSKASVDSHEVYGVVKHVLAEHGIDRQTLTAHQGSAAIDKDAILSAVREAYESYKPEVEIQQYGLERDEILQCLREGFEEHRGSGTRDLTSQAPREDVMEAVQAAMQNFQPPPIYTEIQELRDELLGVVRQCLDDIKPAMQYAAAEREAGAITREDVFDAVKEGMALQGINHDGRRELEIDREDLLYAVKVGLEGSQARGEDGQVIPLLDELLQDMRQEFKSYSAANGRDTEQVLDAMRDGMESLRMAVENYVDRAQDVTGKDEIIDALRTGLHQLRDDVQIFASGEARGLGADNVDRGDMIAFIKAEFEHLHESIGSSSAAGDKQDILNALQDGFAVLGARGIGKESDLSVSSELQDVLRDEFDNMKATIIESENIHKEDIVEAIREHMSGARSRGLSAAEGSVSGSGDEVVAIVKEELGHLRDTLAASLLHNNGSAVGRDEIVDAVRENLDDMRERLLAEQRVATEATFANLAADMAQLRATVADQGISASDPLSRESMEALRTSLEELRGEIPQGGISHEILEAIQGEFDTLKRTVAVGGGSQTEEVLEAVRLGLDDLRSHMDKSIGNPDRSTTMGASDDLIDILNEGLSDLRSEVAKISEKPVDMTVSYEILETLKSGLSGLRADFGKGKGGSGGRRSMGDALNGNEVILVDEDDRPASQGTSTSASAASKDSSLNKTDIEKMEVILAQLQIKVEALDATIQSNHGSSSKSRQQPRCESESGFESTASTIDLPGIEVLLKNLQLDIEALASSNSRHERGSEGSDGGDGVARKEDVEAIETILRNTKDKLDDMEFPSPENLATKEHLHSVQTMVQLTNDTVQDLADKFEDDMVTKEDIATVEVLLKELKTAMEESKTTRAVGGDDDDDVKVERLTKADVDAVGVLCTEIKEKVAELDIPDPDDLPSRADIEQLNGLLSDFRASYDTFKDGYESDIGITAKAFDDRKKEAASMIENLDDIKLTLEEVKDDIQTKLEEGHTDVTTLQETVNNLNETIGSNFNITADVKELIETVNREFEASKGKLDELHTAHGERAAAGVEEGEGLKTFIVADITAKLEEHFLTLMGKYDDIQLNAELQAKAMEEKAAEQEAALQSTRAAADDLKLTVDTLGTTVTAFSDTFTEATEKMSADSKTVFVRMDETFGKIDGHHEANKVEHQETREQVAQVVEGLAGIQGELTEHNPKFMMTLREVLALVQQHYDHSLKAQEAFQEQSRSTSEESRSHIADIKNSFLNLPALLPGPAPLASPPQESASKFDDIAIQQKLDTLLEQIRPVEQSSVQITRLDEIHQSVMQTAMEVSGFVATQAAAISADHLAKEKEAEEVALVLERRLAQKDAVESEITNLNGEKETLRTAVEALRAEQDSLAAEKARLSADVSALHAALEIRREELSYMDEKADALERRVMEGIMNHSRAALLTKTANPRLSRGGPVVPFQRASSSSSQTTSSTLAPTPSVNIAGLALAPKIRSRASRSSQQNQQNPAQRRILSLSTITGNAPSAVQGLKSLTNSPNMHHHSPGGLKRAHSVKTPSGRKTSLGGAVSSSRQLAVGPPLAESNKENETIPEDHEPDASVDDTFSETLSQSLCETAAPTDIDAHSDAGTERRRSFTDTTAPSESEYTYGTGSMYDESSVGGGGGARTRTSFAGTDSDLTYGTGSYLTGTDLDARSSYGSTTEARSMLQTVGTGGTVGGPESPLSTDDDDYEDAGTERATNSDNEEEERGGRVSVGMNDVEVEDFAEMEPQPSKKEMMVLYGNHLQGSDSGLGTDIQTPSVELGRMAGGFH